jgi:hypothetical protein
MNSIRTEAEAIAISLEVGFLRVADAVRWADHQIEMSDVPTSPMCDVAMASSRLPQDVAHSLRSIPGDCDKVAAVQLVLRYARNALMESSSDPRDVARALFDMAVADELPEGDLKSHAFGYWDDIDLARDSTIPQSEAEIVADMVRRIQEFLGDAPASAGGKP